MQLKITKEKDGRMLELTPNTGIDLYQLGRITARMEHMLTVVTGGETDVKCVKVPLEAVVRKLASE